MSLADSKSSNGLVYIDGLVGNTSATGDNSISLGVDSTAGGIDSVSVGSGAIASGSDSIAFGNTAVASGASSIALGLLTTASANNSIAIGNTADTNLQNNCCVINASGTAMTTLPASSGFFVVPVRVNEVAYVTGTPPANRPVIAQNCYCVGYNTSTNELFYYAPN